jgi:transcriptional regulator GlxA family with amidase domain
MLSAAPQPADAREALRTAMHVRALAAIRRRLGDAELSPRMIARAAGLSERLLHRLFQERGETVMGRARLERLDLAAQLLTSSPLRSVADIAFSCGFKDASHFARAFAARFGKTPTRWRDQGVV